MLASICVLLDSGSSITCFYLFYRKMKQISKKLTAWNTNKLKLQKNEELMYLVRKYAILLSVAIVSGWFVIYTVHI